MNSRLFYTLIGIVFFSLFSTHSYGQCTRIGMIGEMTDWAADLLMTRDFENPEMFTAFITVTADDDTSDPADGIIEMKFREENNWDENWGDPAFPSGTGTNGGDNILVPPGSYLVTFNCTTGDYNFESTCGSIGLIGEFTDWAGDHFMTRDASNPNMWSTTISVTDADDTSDPADGIIEMKFRQNAGWDVNWGDPAFPSGTATAGGDNVLVPVGNYVVTFDCSTGEYNFVSTCGSIGLIGEFTDWAGDHFMTRDASNPDMWSTILKVTAEDDTSDPADGIIEMKFRENAGWDVNWGDPAFPSGTATAGGDNILVPPGDYMVTFNCSTGDYNFESTCGEIGMIGEFNNWNGDFPMNRDAANPNMWTVIKSLSTAHDLDTDNDVEVKFRADAAWDNNWGATGWPSGTGVDGGDNIPAVAGTYDVSFNCESKAYSFTTNDNVCGDIGMIGDFNGWGIGGSGEVSDVVLVRNPDYPSQFSLTYNFSGGTKMLFRENADPAVLDVWGGTFPAGTAIDDNGVTMFDIPGGTFDITFNCKSGDFNFERLGSSVAAPKVFAINVDGSLNEADWTINQPVSKLIDGDAGDDPNVVNFGAAYNDDFLYVGVEITDATIMTGQAAAEDNDAVLIAVDGDKSGGDYDASDIAFSVDADGNVTMVQGTATTVAAVTTTASGYFVEASVAWADLGVTPAPGSQIGFDIGVVDADADGYQSYTFWNGDLSDSTSTSALGALLFGELACGSISISNPDIGDVDVRPLSDDPTTYVATYEFESDMNVLFRKDRQGTVAWGATDFPTGMAIVGGDAIPVTTGRYRISFGCLDGSYSFTSEPTSDEVAYADYTDTAPVIDGDLSEYNLQYGMDAGIVTGSGTINPVEWGARWDAGNLYIAAKVVDSPVEGTNNPWDNDAIEMYIDGNHDSDGAFDGDFDTQLILDAINESMLWVKADGVPVTNFESIWFITSEGYNIELRLGWDNFSFVPGRNRTMGFTIGNNDSDQGIGRDYQSAWAGTADNWNNTSVHGDLQLAGGPLNTATATTDVMYNEFVAIYPNPAGASGFNIATMGDVFTGETQIEMYNLVGQMVTSRTERLIGGTSVFVNSSKLSAGTYFVKLKSEDGNLAVKKVIIQQ